jgi:hypothetical protein
MSLPSNGNRTSVLHREHVDAHLSSASRAFSRSQLGQGTMTSSPIPSSNAKLECEPQSEHRAASRTPFASDQIGAPERVEKDAARPATIAVTLGAVQCEGLGAEGQRVRLRSLDAWATSTWPRRSSGAPDATSLQIPRASRTR